MISVFDMFKIGIGPSSSHTVGPMKAARAFVLDCIGRERLAQVQRVEVQLYGSLSATGKGHATDSAILLGLAGYAPDTIDPDRIQSILAEIRASQRIQLAQVHTVFFDEATDLHYRSNALPLHANGMQMRAFGAEGQLLAEQTYYSVGGGFIATAAELSQAEEAADIAASSPVEGRFVFSSADDLLRLAKQHRLSLADIMRSNERLVRSDAAIDSGLLEIWHTMQACIERGSRAEGVLPGRLQVRRRAPQLTKLLAARANGNTDPLQAMEWVNLYAMAVNEENASGGRVVTAPTNGAAGIIPAVLQYYCVFVGGATTQKIAEFLLTAGAIGILYKMNASISGAEVGCQGEVGVACSMAAAGLCAVLGGTPEQVENAAEIGMEHHLGLTCDPVGGLVQIPCIERNALASVKAINAARMALLGDGLHHISLDQVIDTMRATGADMHHKYKETSLGGLAVHIPVC